MPGCPDSPKPEVVFNLQMMMSLGVADLNAWWQYIEQKEFTKKYAGIMCKPPGTQPRGYTRAIPERSHRRSLAHSREPEIVTNGVVIIRKTDKTLRVSLPSVTKPCTFTTIMRKSSYSSKSGNLEWRVLGSGRLFPFIPVCGEFPQMSNSRFIPSDTIRECWEIHDEINVGRCVRHNSGWRGILDTLSGTACCGQIGDS